MLFDFRDAARATVAFAIAFSFALSASKPSFAWNDVGHMAVAGIAYKHLTAQTRVKCDALVKLNPYYQSWVANLPYSSAPDDKNMMIFMLAATWPDAIKGDKAYKSDGSNGGHKPDVASASQNIGYSDHLLHKYWHFVDYPFSEDGSALPGVPSPNAETEISQFNKILASDQPDSLKSYDLTWLLHIVGDVHQPLHCVTRVIKGHPDGDNGGNMVHVHSSDDDSNLHAYWDNILGLDNNPSSVMRIVKRLNCKSTNNTSLSDDPGVWIKESNQYAKDVVYAKPVGRALGPYSLTKNYRKSAQTLARKQVVHAGIRLANMLNSSLNSK